MIRIRIPRSLSLDYGSGSKSCPFLQCFMMPTKSKFFFQVTDRRSIKKSQNCINRGFQIVLLVYGRIQTQIRINNYGFGSGTPEKLRILRIPDPCRRLVVMFLFERAGSEANCKEPGTIKELKEQNKCASVVGRTSSIFILQYFHTLFISRNVIAFSIL